MLLAGVMAFVGEIGASRPVGFEQVLVPDPGASPLRAAIWYPTHAHPWPSFLGLDVQNVAKDARVVGHDLPLVVISHGSNGDASSHLDAALALARAGFVVVAPVHTGDNSADPSSAGGPTWLIDRARHIPVTVDFMLKRWSGHDQIDPGRIAIFGFSSGGFTGLTAIGGRPDLKLIATHCTRFPELACRLWKPGSALPPGPRSFAHDPRIKAAVIAAPGFGFTFAPDGLSEITAPVQLRSGEADINVPYATNTALARKALGAKVEYHSVPGAGHFAFLTPCGWIGPAVLCRDAKGFDRKAFHRRLNADVVSFFQAKLGRASPP